MESSLKFVLFFVFLTFTLLSLVSTRQFLVARSLCTKLSDSRYFIPEATWVARCTRQP